MIFDTNNAQWSSVQLKDKDGQPITWAQILIATSTREWEFACLTVELLREIWDEWELRLDRKGNHTCDLLDEEQVIQTNLRLCYVHGNKIGHQLGLINQDETEMWIAFSRPGINIEWKHFLI